MPENKNNFRFWIPISELTKGKDENGNEVMRVGGIASTKSRDTDNEILDPNGFDISYLQQKGMINWNHSKDPDAVIGEVSKAEIRKEGLHVEGLLYPDRAQAIKVFDLAKSLQKSSKTRRLGWSVEGRATERDPLDPSRVTQAFISNIALTCSPKNPDSIVDIMKGNFHGWDDDGQPPALEGITESDFETANGGKQYIVDIVRPDGMRVTVDSDFNIEVHKAMATNTASGQAVQHESVDGETKDQRDSNLKKSEEETTELETGTTDEVSKSETETEVEYLSQDDVIQKIISADSVISFEKANEIFNVLNNLTMSAKTKITEDLLNKAIDKLDLKKGKAGEIDDESNEAKLHRDGGSDTGESQEDEIIDVLDQKEILAGAKKPAKKVSTKSTVQKGEDDEDEKEEKIKKSNEDSLGVLIKSITDLQDMIKSLAVITKAGYDLNKAQSDEFVSLSEKITEFGEAPAAPRKAISKSVERNFEKGGAAGDTLEKSEGGAIIVNVDRAKNQVLNMLDAMAFKGGAYNETYGHAMRMFEGSGVIEPSIQKGIENEFGIKLVRQA